MQILNKITGRDVTKEYHDDYKLRKHVINLVMKEKSVPISVAQEFFNTHIDDIINNVSHDSDPHPRFMDDDEILDEFEEFAVITMTPIRDEDIQVPCSAEQDWAWHYESE